MSDDSTSTRPSAPALAGGVWKRLAPHLRGQVFLFTPKPAPPYDFQSGNRLLLIFIFLELIFGPRLSLFPLLGLPIPPAWLRVPALLALALALVRLYARLRPAQLGLRAWRDWTLTEKSYFLQAFLITHAVFGIILAQPLRKIFNHPGLWGPAAIVIFTNLLWGFHQELVYRGILQTELVRRWGSWPGILVSNALFTFGPLHFYHLARGGAGAAPMLIGIFVTGLLFGVLFRTSGNLWIIGILHGLGNCYIDGLGELGRR